MEVFDKLGREVEERWSRQNYDERVFPDLAVEALERFAPHREVDPLAVLRWAATGKLPPQPNLDSKFGEPPTTVFHTSRFYIEVLFWLDGTTSVHQHGFSGAFHVLKGSSVHTRRRFETTRIVNGHFRLGNLTLESAELLDQGATRPILSGTPLIHALFHLDRPSVSVVVRTARDVQASPQLKYLAPHVAVDSFYAEPGNTRRLQVLATLAKLSIAQYVPLVSDLIKTLDLQSTFYVLEHANEVIGATRVFQLLLDEVRLRHGPCADLFREVFVEERRQRVLVAQRKLLDGADERYFLALVMNLGSRAQILDFLGRRWPDLDPMDRALKLLQRVTVPEADPKQANRTALEWTGHVPALLRHLLRGLPGAAFFQEVEAHGQPVAGEVDGLRALHTALLTTHPYRVLFAAPAG